MRHDPRFYPPSVRRAMGVREHAVSDPAVSYHLEKLSRSMDGVVRQLAELNKQATKLIKLFELWAPPVDPAAPDDERVQQNRRRMEAETELGHRLPTGEGE